MPCLLWRAERSDQRFVFRDELCRFGADDIIEGCADGKDNEAGNGRSNCARVEVSEIDFHCEGVGFDKTPLDFGRQFPAFLWPDMDCAEEQERCAALCFDSEKRRLGNLDGGRKSIVARRISRLIFWRVGRRPAADERDERVCGE